MGNCLALRKEIEIVKAEGKVLEYRTALKVQKAKVSFLDQQIEDYKEAGPLRVKLIISRRELQQMLQKGAVSVADRGSPLLEGEQTLQILNIDDSGHCKGWSKGWKPILESIPEVGKITIAPQTGALLGTGPLTLSCGKLYETDDGNKISVIKLS